MLTELPVIGIALVQTTATESENLVYGVMLSFESEETVTVDFEILGLTADQGDDFEVVGYPGVFTGTLIFPPCITEYQLNIVAVDDNTLELDESLQIVLSNPTNATLGGSVAEGLIVDNDPFVVIERVKEGFEPFFENEEAYVCPFREPQLGFCG